MDYEAYKAAAMAGDSVNLGKQPTEKLKKSTSSLSLIVAMLIAAVIGFNATHIDVHSMNEKTGHIGDRHAVWRTMLGWVGIDDLAKYRSDRMRQRGLEKDFSNNSWEDDMKMFITDAMGPKD